MSDILISINVRIHNIEKYLKKCIESLEKQTYTNIEIILVDDGSTDSSGVICDDYAARDSRIIVVHKKNEGLVSARKTGANIATGSFITNVDGDDWIEPSRIENLVQKGLSQNADMVYMNGFYKDYLDSTRFVCSRIKEGLVSGKKEIKESIIDKVMNCECCFKTNLYPAMWLWAVKTAIYKKIQNLIPNNIKRAEDVMFNLICLLSVESVAVVQECGYHYVQRPNSMMGSGIRLEYSWRNTIKKIITEEIGSIDVYLGRLIDYFTISSILLSDYEAIACGCKDFLYPYSIVRPQSKVVVYGAGNMGHQIVQFIRNSKFYFLCAWLDRNEKIIGTVKDGTMISSLDMLVRIKFDFIVVAIYDYESAQEARKELAYAGIDKEKIALMDPNVIADEFIPVIYR